MTFSEQYLALEEKFHHQVEKDRQECGIESWFVHNIEPEGPVIDFVLVAMEPSSGISGKAPPCSRKRRTSD